MQGFLHGTNLGMNGDGSIPCWVDFCAFIAVLIPDLHAVSLLVSLLRWTVGTALTICYQFFLLFAALSDLFERIFGAVGKML